MNDFTEKESLSICLDGLLTAFDAMEEIKDLDNDLAQWYKQIGDLYENILTRYES